MCVAIYYTRKCADCQSIYFATRCIHKMKRIHHAPPALAAAGRLRYIYIVRQTTRNEGYPMKIEEISARLAGLAVFRGLLEDPVLAAYSALIRALAEGAGRLAVCEAAGTFEAGLFAADTDDLSDYIASAVLECENICARRAARGALSPALEK